MAELVREIIEAELPRIKELLTVVNRGGVLRQY